MEAFFCLNGLMNLSMEESSRPLCECVLYMLHCSPCWLSVTCRDYFSRPPKPPEQSHCLSLHPVHAWGEVNGKCPSGFFALNTQETDANSEENGYSLLLVLLCFCLRKMFPNWRGRCTLLWCFLCRC